MTFEIINGNSLEVLKTFADNSVDSVVTDPPYGLSFMDKKWDYDVPAVDIWKECLRVLKPGGHLLAFAGTRTQHRMAVNIEDAGFEIRDMIAWVYGSGFPKSLDVSKAIDKAAGVEREITGERLGDVGIQGGNFANASKRGVISLRDKPTTIEAEQWAGWGTGLKPALEPITVARKPINGTVASNVLEHGTGALNIDGCRVAVDPDDPVHSAIYHAKPSVAYGKFASKENRETRSMAPPSGGRWPSNLIHDGSEEVSDLFPNNKSSPLRKTKRSPDSGGRSAYVTFQGQEEIMTGYGDSGSAARFFYCSKASKKDREENNDHPTVKPTDLMRYLCRLITPPNGIVLDPFMGSGSTGKAALLENFNFIGIELDEHYCEIAQRRLEKIKPPVTLDELFL